MKRIIILCFVGLMTITVNAQGYVDLGLSSGTRWKKTNESGYYTIKEVHNRFGTNLPSQYQWQELKKECKWTWTGNGYKVTGPNGNYIHLPLAGYRNGEGTVVELSRKGTYWTSTTYYGPVFFVISESEKRCCDGLIYDRERSVRLVQNY